MTTLRSVNLVSGEPRTVAGSVLTLLLIAAGYLSHLAPWFALIALLAVALTIWDPAGVTAAVPAVIGLTYLPLRAGGLEFSAAETLIVALVAGVGLRVVASLVRTAPEQSVARARALLREQVGLTALVAVALLLVGTLSLFTVAMPAYRHESLRFYRWVILEPLIYFALAGHYLRKPATRRLAALLFVLGGAFVALSGLLDLARGSGVAVEGVLRISGVYPHPNALALFIERPLVFAAVLGLLARHRDARLWLIPGAVMAVALLFTFSRGAILAAGVALVFTLWLAGQRRLAGLLAAAGVVAGVVVGLTATARIVNLFSGGSGSLRLDVWRSSLTMLRVHPVFGIGLDQFLYVYAPRYVLPAAWSERFTSHPHDIVLDVWLSLGILGLVLALGYVIALARLERRALERQRSLAIAAGAAIVAGLLHGLVDNGYFLPDLALAFWFLTVLMDLDVRPVTA